MTGSEKQIIESKNKWTFCVAPMMDWTNIFCNLLLFK